MTKVMYLYTDSSGGEIYFKYNQLCNSNVQLYFYMCL